MHTKQDFLLWGHSLAQYCLMFDLNPEDLNQKILDCASGYASFNAEMNKIGHEVVACDPAYNLGFAELQQQMENGLNNLLAHIKNDPTGYVWETTSLQQLIQDNETSLKQFLADFPEGKKLGRYVAAALPKLPFTANQFDLAVCAYFLFSSPDLTQQFHIEAIKELCRVAREVRIYPLLDQNGSTASNFPNILMQLQQENYGIEIKQVVYELQKGSNAMLRVWSQACQV